MEDNMHDKENDIRSFLRNVFTADEFDVAAGAGMISAHETPRSLEEMADALKPKSVSPCPGWMNPY